MNSEENTISGWLHVYIVFLTALIANPFIPIVEFFSPIPKIIIVLYIICLILIYNKSKYAISINKITLVIVILLEIFTTYKLFNIISEVPQFIFNLLITVNVAIVIVSLLFIFYWYKSIKVENIFSDSMVISETSTFLFSEKTGGQPINVQVNNQQVNTQLHTGHLAIFNLISFISCGMFIYAGWGAFIAIPVSLFFSIFYSIIFRKVLKKNNGNTFMIYSVAFTLVFAYISLLFNFGIATDSPQIGYLAPSLLGLPDASFTLMFNKLFDITWYYLLLSIPLNIILIKKNASKIFFFFVPLAGLILIAIHWGVIFTQFPELKAEAARQRQEQKQSELARIEEIYNFNWSKINEYTFENRTYSIFTPSALLTKTPTNECPYATEMVQQNLSKKGFKINCLNNMLKPIGQVPITQTKALGVNIPNISNLFKKGDIVVVVAELENPSMMRVYANGNGAKDCNCRMSPYDYSGVVDYIKIGTSTQIYEHSVVQMEVTDKKRTVMILYPINVNNLKNLDIKLSPFSDNPNVPVTLREVSVLSPLKVSTDPEWLKEWSKKPNPFLNN